MNSNHGSDLKLKWKTVLSFAFTITILIGNLEFDFSVHFNQRVGEKKSHILGGPKNCFYHYEYIDKKVSFRRQILK
jgi:hypothetical protein